MKESWQCKCSLLSLDNWLRNAFRFHSLSPFGFAINHEFNTNLSLLPLTFIHLYITPLLQSESFQEEALDHIFMANLSVSVCLITLFLCFASGSVAKQEEDGTYELRKGDFSVKFTKWGASIVSVVLPDKHGRSFLLLKFC